jgi:pyrroline-5-carboxylate reductase
MYRVGILASDKKVNDFIEALTFDNFCSSTEILVVFLVPQLEAYITQNGIQLSADIHELVNCTDAILLIGNESESLNGLTELSGDLPENLIVLSFVKNLSLDSLIKASNHKAVIRATITPFVGQNKNGLVFLFKTPNLDLLALPASVISILSQLGDTQEVPSEDMLEQSSNLIEMMVSAVEQSLVAFIDTLVESGLSEGNAKKIAFNLWAQWVQSGTQLRERFQDKTLQIPPIFDELDFGIGATPNLYTQLKNILVAMLLFRSRSS